MCVCVCVSASQVLQAHALYFGRYPRAIPNYRGPMSLFAYQWTFGVTNSEAAWRSAHSEAPRLEGERAMGIDMPQAMTVRAPRGSTPPLIFTLDSIGTVSRRLNEATPLSLQWRRLKSVRERTRGVESTGHASWWRTMEVRSMMTLIMFWSI